MYLLSVFGNGTNTANFPSDCYGTGGLYNLGDYTGVFRVDIEPTLVASRQNLMKFALTASPATGFDGYTQNNLGNAAISVTVKQTASCQGSVNNQLQTFTCPVANVSPASVSSTTGVFQYADPPNPSPMQTPNPGLLGTTTMSLTYPPVRSYGATLEARIPTFGMSCYSTIAQSSFGEPAPDGTTGTCMPIRIHGVTYAGVVTNPYPALPGTFCASFIAELQLNGSAIFDYDPYTGMKMQYYTSTHQGQFVDVIRGSDGPLTANGSVARDYTIIPRHTTAQTTRYRVKLDTYSGQLEADDTGGNFQGVPGGVYRLDLYAGEAGSACSAAANPILVGACNPATPGDPLSATCPSLTDDMNHPIP
jgi:hypothetical protein